MNIIKFFSTVFVFIVFATLINIFPDEYIPILFFVGFWLMWYKYGLLVAEIDNKIISPYKVKLPLWEKRMLFPFHNNKFNKRTVIAQRIWTYYAIVVIIAYLFTWKPQIAIVGIVIQIPLMFILGLTCDMHSIKFASSGRDETRIKARKERDRQKRKRERERRR